MRTPRDINPLPRHQGSLPWPAGIFPASSAPPCAPAAESDPPPETRRFWLRTTVLTAQSFAAGLLLVLAVHLGFQFVAGNQVTAAGRSGETPGFPPQHREWSATLAARINQLARQLERTPDPVLAARHRILLEIKGF